MDEKKKAEVLSLFKDMEVPANEPDSGIKSTSPALSVSETNIIGTTIVLCGNGDVDNVISYLFGRSRRK